MKFFGFPFLLFLFLSLDTVHSEFENLRLEFVQTLWRHGDRAALAELYPIFLANWTFGGGGLGELTPLGMSQLNDLGTIFRKKYVIDQEFLNHRYAANEVYIRSTDVNRTIISAMSLLYGFFPPGAWNVQGVDYPSNVNWQQGMTFVPIHIDGMEHCSVNQQCKCDRYEELQEKWADLPEVQTASAKMIALNRRVASYYNVTGADADTFSYYADTWTCQRNWFNDTLYQKLPWYNEDLYREAQEANAPFKRFTEGRFLEPSIVDGIDIGKETQILLSGPMMNEIYERARDKMKCSQELRNCTSYLKPLKFYGYSSHDMMVYGLLVSLGVPELSNSLNGWPNPASSLVFEFYSDLETSEQFVKFLYRDSSDSELSDVTSLVPGCDNSTFCTMQNFWNIAERVKPMPDLETLCNTPLSGTGSSGRLKYWMSILVLLIVLL